MNAPACGRWLFCGNVPWADTACNRRLVVFSGFRSLNHGLYWIIYLVGLLPWSLCHPWIASQQSSTGYCSNPRVTAEPPLGRAIN